MPQINYLNKRLATALCLLIVVFLMNNQTQAQIVIGTPNLGFSQACASNDFNTYSTTFIFSPESELSVSNQFVVELSDASGDFINATNIYTSLAGNITSSPATIDFSIPETTAGENYKIRIKSSSPVATSAASAVFAAHYKLQDEPFSINNLVASGAYCTNGSYLLTIDNPGNINNDSPLNYPSLTFNWYKETSATTSVFVATGNTLAVNEEGTYYVETNYGSCTSNSFSNRVTISEVSTSSNSDATIISSLGNPYCPEEGLTTLITIGGNNYQWFKDGVEIPEAINQTYQTETSGTFSVQVDLGDCTASGSIDLVSELFESTINVNPINTILEGETLDIVVNTSNSVNLDFEWYYNNELIIDAISNSYVASAFGDYEVVITETSGCTASRFFQFSVNQGTDPFPDVNKIPNSISPNGDLINDTWIIPLQYTTGTNTEVVILNDRGQVVFETLDYQNNWPNDNLKLSSINQIYYYIITLPNGRTKKGSITLIK